MNTSQTGHSSNDETDIIDMPLLGRDKRQQDSGQRECRDIRRSNLFELSSTSLVDITQKFRSTSWTSNTR